MLLKALVRFLIWCLSKCGQLTMLRKTAVKVPPILNCLHKVPMHCSQSFCHCVFLGSLIQSVIITGLASYAGSKDFWGMISTEIWHILVLFIVNGGYMDSFGNLKKRHFLFSLGSIFISFSTVNHPLKWWLSIYRPPSGWGLIFFTGYQVYLHWCYWS